jgi:phosphatidylserine/phosphatidylglycerophosphate/cardiolipin synthase-like enzyme
MATTMFENTASRDGFRVKAWRGERMCLLGFDVDEPADDLVGFAIACRSPHSSHFVPLRNRINFSYDKPVTKAVTGARQFLSTEAPFQKFRWVHFPKEPKAGRYTYRVTPMHMPADGVLKSAAHLDVEISLDPVTFAGALDVGFTRNFASSQAYAERFKNREDIIPEKADDGLAFVKQPADAEIYDWLGFEAHALLFRFLQDAIADPTITVDAFAYDLNEPEIVSALEQLGPRLRAIIDDSTTSKDGVKKGHGVAASPESQSAKRLRASAGASHVKRTHFQNLQHHKVLIAKRNGVPFKVLAGSTNFSFRGLYIQANNVLVFEAPEIAALFARVFDAAFHDPAAFEEDPLAKSWHDVTLNGGVPVHIAFSPHLSTDLSLNPVRGAIDLASSSVLYSVAFLNLIKSGPTKEALDRLMTRPVFSYGVVDQKSSLEVRKPDGSTGLVDFAFLAKTAPEPFRSEWSGGRGINIHHKFVVTDFSLPTAKVFTGSSNLSPSGEDKNGDHLILIEDRKVAIAYAIEALRIFDHLHFRSVMRDVDKKIASNGTAKKAKAAVKPLLLRKPTAISGEPAWFEKYFVKDTQRARDRLLFSR